jgi:hypothetical protein
MSEENKTPQAATPPQGQVSAELTVQDLSVLKTIIEVAQSRGAFKANELEAVGKTFNKLETFLTTVSNQQVGEQAKAPATPAAAPKTEVKDTPVSSEDAAAALGAS